MKKLILGILCVLFLMLDNTLMPFLAVKTYYPSLLFTFSICYSIINGKWEGIWIGVFSGLLQDLYFLNTIGINALANMLVCVLAAEVGENIFKEKKLIPVVSSFFLCTLKGIMVFVISYIIGHRTDIMATIYVSIYTMVVAFLMYKKVYNLSQKHFMKKEWKF